MGTAKATDESWFAHRGSASVQMLAQVLLGLLSGCSLGGDGLTVGVQPDLFAVQTVSGAIVMGEVVDERQIRAQLFVTQWTNPAAVCTPTLFSGVSCPSTMTPVRDKRITLSATGGTLSESSVVTGVDGTARFELVAPRREGITITAESGSLKTSQTFTLEPPFSQLSFLPVRDTIVGVLDRRSGVSVEFVDADGRSPSFARALPPVHVELVDCAASAELYGNDDTMTQPGARPDGRWVRTVFFSFTSPGTNCRWKASAPGFPTVTSEPFSVLVAGQLRFTSPPAPSQRLNQPLVGTAGPVELVLESASGERLNVTVPVQVSLNFSGAQCTAQFRVSENGTATSLLIDSRDGVVSLADVTLVSGTGRCALAAWVGLNSLMVRSPDFFLP